MSEKKQSNPNRRSILLSGTALVAASIATDAFAQAQKAAPGSPAAGPAPSSRRPNILVIFGDDIGQTNISAYSFGLMGYRTPNIDRIAKEGMMFTDYYAEQSCTAGRSSFITGQCTLRTGLSKVGMPGASVGLQANDATIAELLKPMGYATGQFGKNHLGDRNEYLPTVHGFDEFFGNLYHLNAEEDPESRTYPRDTRFRDTLGPRGVLRCKATDRDDPTEHPRWGRVGKQTIEDTGPLTKKRMETIDDETSAAAIDFMQRQARANTPFFCWFNTTRMHFRTHVRDSHRDQPGLTSRTEYADGMIETDATVGAVLKALDDLGIANDTIVLYTTDNGPHQNSWPDAGTTPFRSEKNTNWEGAFRVPCMIRWPGRIQPGSISNDIVSGLDWLPTLLAAAGDPEIKSKLLKGHQVGGKTFKVHLDGYNQLPYLTGQQANSARKEFVYFNDDGDLVAMRYENWKIVFEEQRASGTLRIWAEPFTKLRVPKMFDLRSDPYERADLTSNSYYDWFTSNPAPFLASQAIVGPFLATFKEYPPSQRPSSFSIDQLIEKMQRSLEPAH
ncbi:arylsulfatase [Bradyrhizobium japonicum]|uniref:Arylsulfatase n=1 Tax=Bradyrhizobium diazoefficiens TaxID=1355477 RepID=A0A809YMH3_9BRAD|nr:arylsulfatase [Bradyrhizobium diazoefficiens]MBP1063961.1 arylsulfatase [Bradyrhizobium japonicum]BCA05642.1 arylsulfatase [Bradyrhizobium diazoefficiens]BCA22996.1 arylsulfatase [Bradyrhizobium diazoefficiens]BCE32369.1 arylsulfatase [Bradyrhizobium diazoefficiens]BCE41154.1 arylsulfatase [Bradyrhizobium diazoefficiens]